MPESNAHKLIKEQAKQILLEKGFKEEQIFYEQRHTINNKVYVVDVVAIDSEVSIAVECGNVLNPSKIEDLNNNFNQVIHLPYLVDYFETDKKRKTINVSQEIFDYLEKHPSINFSGWVEENFKNYIQEQNGVKNE